MATETGENLAASSEPLGDQEAILTTEAVPQSAVDDGSSSENAAGPAPPTSLKTPPIVLPDAFLFHVVIPNNGKDPGGWKESDCVTIRFLRPGGVFARPSFFDISVKVGVPIRNQDGDVSDWHAQDASSEAATAAGLEIIAMLNSGSLTVSEVQPLFVKKMSFFLAGTIKGSRVSSCSGGARKEPAMTLTM